MTLRRGGRCLTLGAPGDHYITNEFWMIGPEDDGLAFGPGRIGTRPAPVPLLVQLHLGKGEGDGQSQESGEEPAKPGRRLPKSSRNVIARASGDQSPERPQEELRNELQQQRRQQVGRPIEEYGDAQGSQETGRKNETATPCLSSMSIRVATQIRSWPRSPSPPNASTRLDPGSAPSPVFRSPLYPFMARSWCPAGPGTRGSIADGPARPRR